MGVPQIVWFDETTIIIVIVVVIADTTCRGQRRAFVEEGVIDVSFEFRMTET